jgi:hypothetical protein
MPAAQVAVPSETKRARGNGFQKRARNLNENKRLQTI